MIKVFIEDEQGKREEKNFEITEFIIGRQSKCQICLPERNISRMHAKVFKKGDAVFLEDLNSYNGVYLNGERLVGCQRLSGKDIITIGDFQLEISGNGIAAVTESTSDYNVDSSEADTLSGVDYPSEDTDTEQTIPDGELDDYAQNEDLKPRVAGSSIRGNNRPAAPKAAAPAPSSHTSLTEAMRTVKDDPVPDGPRHEPTALIRLDQIDLDSFSSGGGLIQSEKQPKLLCVSTNLAGTEYLLRKSENIIGRIDEGNDVQIDHRSISKHHARITVDGTTYRIIDLKSANGTLVNGEEYAQTTLRLGDLIELGHVKLRFVTPGHTYQPTAEEYETINQARNPEAAAKAAARRANNDRDQLDEDRQYNSPAPYQNATAGPGKSVTVMIIGMGCVMLAALVVVIAILLKDRQDTRGAMIAAQPPQNMAAAPVAANQNQPAAQAKSPEAITLFQRALSAYNEKHFQEAMALVEATLTIDPNYQEAVELKKQLTVETKVETVFKDVSQAIAARHFDEANRLLDSVPANSSRYAEVQGLRARVQSGLIDNLAEKASGALDRGDIKVANELANKIGTIDPNSPQLDELRDKIAAASNAAEERRAAVAANTNSRPAPAKKVKEESKKEAPAKESPRKAAPAQKEEAPKAAAASGNPKELYQQASKQLLQGDFANAIKTFETCIQVDSKACYCYRGLGITYAKYRRSAQAVKYYKRYLSCNPNAPDAAQVTKIIEQYESN